MSHTPGEYYLVGSKIAATVNGRQTILASVHLFIEPDEPGIHRANKTQAEANARLFASSPELLEACKAAAEFLDRTVFEDGEYICLHRRWPDLGGVRLKDRLEAVIHKAEGDAP